QGPSVLRRRRPPAVEADWHARKGELVGASVGERPHAYPVDGRLVGSGVGARTDVDHVRTGVATGGADAEQGEREKEAPHGAESTDRGRRCELGMSGGF